MTLPERKFAKPLCYFPRHVCARRSAPSEVAARAPTPKKCGWSVPVPPLQFSQAWIEPCPRDRVDSCLDSPLLHSQAADLKPLEKRQRLRRPRCAPAPALSPGCRRSSDPWRSPPRARPLYPPPRPQLTVSARGRSRRQTWAPYFSLTPAHSRCHLVVPHIPAADAALTPP